MRRTDFAISAILRGPRSIAGRVLPSRVVHALKVLMKSSPIIYSGPYESWAAAEDDAVGYDDPTILQAIRHSSSAVKEGRAAYERDAVAHMTIGFRWPMLACVLHVALQENASSGRSLHILDFGGSLGSVYFQHRAFLGGLPSLLWSIVEQPHFVECGNAEFSDQRLRYFNTIADVAARASIDCAVFSGSLEYLERPHDVLAEIGAFGCKYLIVDALHTADGNDDQVKVQRIKPPFYSARLAVRFFAKEKLVNYLRSIGYEVIATLPQGFFCKRT